MKGAFIAFVLHHGRDLHARHFGRKTETEFAAYCQAKEFNPVSIDGLPALPLPLPLRPGTS